MVRLSMAGAHADQDEVGAAPQIRRSAVPMFSGCVHGARSLEHRDQRLALFTPAALCDTRSFSTTSRGLHPRRNWCSHTATRPTKPSRGAQVCSKRLAHQVDTVSELGSTASSRSQTSLTKMRSNLR